MRGEAQGQSQGQRKYRGEGGQAHTANARSAEREGGQARTANARGGTKATPGAARTREGGQAQSQCARRHKANPRRSAYTEAKEGRHTANQSQGSIGREAGQEHTQPMRREAQSQSPGQRRGGTKLNPGAAHAKGRRASTHSQCAGRHDKANPGQRIGREGGHAGTHTHTQPMRGEAQSQTPGQCVCTEGKAGRHAQPMHKAKPKGSACKGKEGRHTQPTCGEA